MNDRVPPCRMLLMLSAALLLAACSPGEPDPMAVGQLASDRVEIAFEVHARILERGPEEGSDVAADTVLFVLDPAEIEVQLRVASAHVDELTAALAELTNGTRPEVLAQARSDRAGARDTVAFRRREVQRLEGLVERALVAASEVDAARTALDEAESRLATLEARFDELTAGPRPEAIDRARAALAAAEAEQDRLELQQQRHHVVAGIAGRLDRYVFEPGEWASEGAVGAVLLSGAQPWASVFLPAAMRAELAVGDRVEVRVEGFEQNFEGRVHWISSEAAFTPYYALTERDRGRLSYRAEIALATDRTARLPDGLPVEVHEVIGR